MLPEHGFSKSTIESLAGFSAGTVSTLAVHPLDIIKTRLQLSSRSPSTTTPRLPSISILLTLLTREGPPLRSLYRGLTPNLIGNSLGWSLYFLWYSQTQTVIRRLRSLPPAPYPLAATDYLLASLASGLLSSALTNPIWVIKTRMLATPASDPNAYPSFRVGLARLAREEGVRGYLRGLVPALAGVSHGAVYFVAYEKMKESRGRQLEAIATMRPTTAKPTTATMETTETTPQRLSNTDYLLISGLAKILAGGLTYPHQVVRARMQSYAASVDGPTAAGTKVRVGETVMAVWRADGWRGFYRGLGPNLLRVVPSTCVTFLVYENVKWGLSGG